MYFLRVAEVGFNKFGVERFSKLQFVSFSQALFTLTRRACVFMNPPPQSLISSHHLTTSPPHHTHTTSPYSHHLTPPHNQLILNQPLSWRNIWMNGARKYNTIIKKMLQQQHANLAQRTGPSSWLPMEKGFRVNLRRPVGPGK